MAGYIQWLKAIKVMGQTESRAYRRQIRTTLTSDQEMIFDAICRARGIKEPQFAREAIIEKMETLFSDQVIEEVKEEEIFQKVKGALNQLMRDHSKMYFQKITQ
jgi:hypothetical protein